MRILIVEDNQRLAQLLVDGLQHRGFAGDIARTLDDATSALSVSQYDAMILDLGLPDGDGVKWLAEQRARNHLLPVLILTGRDGLPDRIAGLNAGGDDYVVKPMDIEELAARIRALLRRPGPRSQTRLEAGHLCFDTASRELHSGEVRIDLARREADLLEILMRRLGSVVTREAIENALYSFEEAVTPNALEVNVSRLRKKLSDAEAGCTLHTVRGVGYLLQEN